MTVCIGALCDSKTAGNTASIVLCADTLITYASGGVPITSNINGSKLFPLPLGFYGAIADDITQSHIFASKLEEGMRELSSDAPDFYDKVKLVVDATGEYIRSWRRLDVLARFGVTLDEFLHDKNLATRIEIENEIANPQIPVAMIVAGFKGETPVLFYHDGLRIHEQASLGFYTAGSGDQLALYWLNFRDQCLGMSSQRTVYHVLEAKRFAEQNPTVGCRSVVLFMTPQKTSMLDTINGLPEILKTWKAECYVKTTDQIDKAEWHDPLFTLFTPLNPGKSEPGQ